MQKHWYMRRDSLIVRYDNRANAVFGKHGRILRELPNNKWVNFQRVYLNVQKQANAPHSIPIHKLSRMAVQESLEQLVAFGFMLRKPYATAKAKSENYHPDSLERKYVARFECSEQRFDELADAYTQLRLRLEKIEKSEQSSKPKYMGSYYGKPIYSE